MQCRAQTEAEQLALYAIAVEIKAGNNQPTGAWCSTQVKNLE